MYWELDIKDILIDFIRDDFTQTAAENLMNSLELGAYEELYAPMSAARLISVYSNSNYSFSIKELNWLRSVQKVICYRLTDFDDLSLFFVDLSSEKSEYYFVTAALIKIFNIAFPGRIIYICKTDNAVAFGSARDFVAPRDNNFVVSGLFSQFTDEECFDWIQALFLSDLREVPSIIRQYSPHEDMEDDKYERAHNAYEYMLSLEELELRYGLDTSRERERAIYGYSNAIRVYSYRDACIELRGIADTEESSSYQDLEAAVEAERKAKKAQYLGHVGATSSDVEEPLFDLSAEAYSNAEQMLKELLERDNEAKRGDKP